MSAKEFKDHVELIKQLREENWDLRDRLSMIKDLLCSEPKTATDEIKVSFFIQKILEGDKDIIESLRKAKNASLYGREGF